MGVRASIATIFQGERKFCCRKEYIIEELILNKKGSKLFRHYYHYYFIFVKHIECDIRVDNLGIEGVLNPSLKEICCYGQQCAPE